MVPAGRTDGKCQEQVTVSHDMTHASAPIAYMISPYLLSEPVVLPGLVLLGPVLVPVWQ